MKSAVLHPYALDNAGRMINIHDAQRGELYLCLCHKSPMLVKRGKVKQPHFAHKQAGLYAEPDTVLHKTAQALIVQTINDTKSVQGVYRLGYPCPECKKSRSRNIISEIIRVETEKTIVPGTRSDIVVYRDDIRPIIIEIVVTHDLEADTRDRYIASETPVFLFHPEWDSLEDLKWGIIADKTFNVDIRLCPQCKKQEERRIQRKEEVSRKVNSLLKRMDERTDSSLSDEPFIPWVHDKFGRTMFPHIRKRVYANALLLTELGFIQTISKPYLFRLPLPQNGVVFANFGSTEEVAIWEDTAALIHWKLGQCEDDFERAVVREVLVRCRKAGVEVRVSFYNLSYDQGKED